MYKLIGIEGIVKGFDRDLFPGDTLTVGRSRSCDVSVRRLAGGEEGVAETQNYEYGTVSRIHITLSVNDEGEIHIQDESSNGTFIDGKKVTDITLKDVGPQGHMLRLGVRETFHLKKV